MCNHALNQVPTMDDILPSSRKAKKAHHFTQSLLYLHGKHQVPLEACCPRQGGGHKFSVTTRNSIFRQSMSQSHFSPCYVRLLLYFNSCTTMYHYCTFVCVLREVDCVCVLCVCVCVCVCVTISQGVGLL